jgi:hypothetical protein
MGSWPIITVKGRAQEIFYSLRTGPVFKNTLCMSDAILRTFSDEKDSWWVSQFVSGSCEFMNKYHKHIPHGYTAFSTSFIFARGVCSNMIQSSKGLLAALCLWLFENNLKFLN